LTRIREWSGDSIRELLPNHPGCPRDAPPPFPFAVRRMIRTTNAINTRYQQAIRARSYFPDKVTTLKKPLPPGPVSYPNHPPMRPPNPAHRKTDSTLLRYP